MKINFIKQSTQILTTSNELAMFGRIIEESGRVCYNSTDKMNVYGENEYSSKFIEGLIDSGHHSVLEHCYVRCELRMSRGMLLDLTRHRIASFSVQSTRYCNYSDEMSFIISPGIIQWYGLCESDKIALSVRLYYEGILRECACTYSKLVKNYNLPPQLAKEILPTSLATIVRMTCNLRELRHILSLRSEKHAHPDIQVLMASLQDELIKNGLPIVLLKGIPNDGDDLYRKYMSIDLDKEVLL